MADSKITTSLFVPECTHAIDGSIVPTIAGHRPANIFEIGDDKIVIIETAANGAVMATTAYTGRIPPADTATQPPLPPRLEHSGMLL